MSWDRGAGHSRYQALGPHHLDRIAARYGLAPEHYRATELFASVLPFRTNAYVLEELIDWDAVPDDPIFQLVFPQPGMLSADHERRARDLQSAAPGQRAAGIAAIRRELNPHPAGQQELNVPVVADTAVRGTQHKYAETVLYFPSQGQTCHAYCTYCFRWAQFVGEADLRFAAPSPEGLLDHLAEHPEVTDVLVTGGDPLIMTAQRLRSHLEPLLHVPTLRTIRIGTKSLGYWPQRFLTDTDAEDLLRFFEQITASGRTLAVMAHISHDRELLPAPAATAIARIRGTGAVLYGQAPIMRRINDDAATWYRMWSAQVALGVVPYYMFMARDTGPREYFEVPVARAVAIFGDAYRNLPGLARTVRGPSMSTTPGKVVIDGELHNGGSRVFAARFLQSRDPALVGRPFTFEYSERAAWLDQLQPTADTPADIRAALTGSQRNSLELQEVVS